MKTISTVGGWWRRALHTLKYRLWTAYAIVLHKISKCVVGSFITQNKLHKSSNMDVRRDHTKITLCRVTSHVGMAQMSWTRVTPNINTIHINTSTHTVWNLRNSSFLIFPFQVIFLTLCSFGLKLHSKQPKNKLKGDLIGRLKSSPRFKISIPFIAQAAKLCFHLRWRGVWDILCHCPNTIPKPRRWKERTSRQ